MSQRSRKRRLSSSRRSSFGILADNTDIVDNDDPLWYDKSIIRPSTSFTMAKNATSVLNSDSSVNVSQASDGWFENLTKSENSKVIQERVRKNINDRLTNEQNKSKYMILMTSGSDSEHGIRKKRAKFKSSQKSKNNKIIDESSDFSKALENISDSHTRNVTNIHISDENDSESNTNESRTTKKLRPKFVRNKKRLKETTNNFDDALDRNSTSERFIINSSNKRKSNINSTTSCTPEKVRFINQHHADNRFKSRYSITKTNDNKTTSFTEILKNKSANKTLIETSRKSLRNRMIDNTVTNSPELVDSDILQNKSPDNTTTNYAKKEFSTRNKLQTSEDESDEEIFTISFRNSGTSKSQTTPTKHHKNTVNISHNEKEKSKINLPDKSRRTNVSLSKKTADSKLSTRNNDDLSETGKKRKSAGPRITRVETISSELYESIGKSMRSGAENVSSGKGKTKSRIPIITTDNERDKSVETSSDESTVVGVSQIKPAATPRRQSLTQNTSGQFNDDLLHRPKRTQSTPIINGKPITQISFQSDGISDDEAVPSISISHSRSVPSRSLPIPEKDVQKKNDQPKKRPPKEKSTTEREKDASKVQDSFTRKRTSPVMKDSWTRKDESALKETSMRKDKSVVKNKPAVKGVAKIKPFTYFGDLPRNSKGLPDLSPKSEEDSAQSRKRRAALKKKLEMHMKNVKRLHQERAQETEKLKSQPSKVSRMSATDWAKLKKRTDRHIEKVSKIMEEENRLKEKEAQKKARLDAELRRVLARQAAERRRAQKKPIDPAYYVNGELYKPPQLPRPKNWVTNRLYEHLWECMEPRYGQRARAKSEKFVLKLADLAGRIEKSKRYENYRDELDELHRTMAKLNIIKTRYDFHRFCFDYMPYSFRIRTVPMMLPGNVRNIPYDPETVFTSILDEDEENSESSDSDTE